MGERQHYVCTHDCRGRPGCSPSESQSPLESPKVPNEAEAKENSGFDPWVPRDGDRPQDAPSLHF